MTNPIIEVINSPFEHGNLENIPYRLDVSAWGSSPTSVTVKAYDITAGKNDDVTSSVLDGTATVSGSVITLPKLKSLTAGKEYKVVTTFAVVISGLTHTLQATARLNAVE